MKDPWFWRERSLAARATAAALAPAALLYDAGQRLRAAATTPHKIAAPVICVGNARIGGAGKTPFALLLHRLLTERGVDARFASRGYGGALKGPVRVSPVHTTQDVGDEPLLLAAAAETWVAKDRLAGVRAAADAGADVVIMDDGFQNPTVAKTVSFLLLSASDIGAALFPGGPMRESAARATARADAIVLGEDAPNVGEWIPADRPLFVATAMIEPTIAPQPVLAFCGLARPERFFTSLEKAGFALAERLAFPDHHFYRPGEIAALKRKAGKAQAALITTEKDFVRLAPDLREGIAVAPLRISIDDPTALADFVLGKIPRAP